MPFDVSGNFTRSYNFVADRSAAIKIQAARMDGEFDNYATALNQVLLRNGVVAFTGNLKMGNNSVTGVAAGSAGTPSISYTGDVTTGIFSPAAGIIGFSCAGTEVARATASGFQVTGRLFFSTDTTSGYSSPGAGALATVVSGAEVARWSGSKLGLGTTTPRTTIDVAGILSQRGAFEDCVVAASALTGTVNLDYITAAVYIMTLNAVANWTFNIRGDGTNTLNSIMANNQMMTMAIEVPQGVTPYYCTAINVDGVAQTVKWQTGAPTAGNASGVDVYLIRVVKTAAATFSVRASQSQEK